MAKYQVRLTKIVHDVVEAFAVVEASSEDDAREKALKAAVETDLQWEWEDSLNCDCDLEAHDVQVKP